MRPFNFSAGPAALPDAALERAQAELLDFRGRGVSVLEMSHRSPEFEEIAATAQANLRALLDIGDSHHVLFLHGGASMQFAMVPMNLCAAGDTVDYIETGAWGAKAIAEARRLANVNVAASSAGERYTHIPARATWRLTSGAAYCHITTNETIGGVQYRDVPDVEAPLVADMSSDLLSRPVDVRRFGLIYAGTQKNLGPAGLGVVIVREDLVGRGRSGVPRILDYAIQAANGSMFNTPPTYAWYLTGLVLEWVRERGGVTAMRAAAERKAGKLYAAIDATDFYRAPVAASARSLMNVPFTLADDRLNIDFLAGAEQRGLLGLRGHRSVGGMRASLYNAVSEPAVDALVSYLAEFEAARG